MSNNFVAGSVLLKRFGRSESCPDYVLQVSRLELALE